MKRSRYLACAAAAVALLVGYAQGASAEDKKYTIYLSNNFVGNDWRQQMERVGDVSVKKGPLAGRVDLKVENVDNTVQAQINSLNNIIRAKPDAILIDAGSAEALNPTIKKACDAGILVISFDQVVSEPCAYALESDWNRIPAVLAEWMAKQLNGKGKVFVDRGLAGAPISAALEKGYLDVLKKYPDIEVIGNYNGEYALGPEQAGVASLLAAHPDVDGILTQGYGTGAMKALTDAGKPVVPVTAFSYNGTAVECAKNDKRQVHPRLEPGIPLARRRSSSRSTSSTASRSRPTATCSSMATSFPPTRSNRNSIPTPSSRRSRSARTPSPIVLPD